MKTALDKGLLLSWITITLVACGGGGDDGSDYVTYDDDTSVIAVPAITVPSAPRDITIENDADGNIVLDWSVSDEADIEEMSEREETITYKVYWSITDHSDLDNRRDSVEVSKPPFIHKNLALGTTYYYAITAVQNEIESELSGTNLSATAGAPTKPENPSAESVYSDIYLSWDSAARAETYSVSWSNGLGESGTIEFATSPFLHTGLVGVEYEYVITASNAYGESMSVVATASPDLPPETPVDLLVIFYRKWSFQCVEEAGFGTCASFETKTLGTVISFSWSDIGTDYEVHRVSHPDETITTSDSRYSQFYSDKSSSPDSYCYYVVAKNYFGISLPTDVVCSVDFFQPGALTSGL